jgi:hypothetical protein
MASDEDVAVMWSRILAGQIRQPGRFSFQTLAVLPEIDRDLAEKFVALSYFLIDGDAVPSWTQFVAHYDAADLPHEWFLRLADARLLNFAPIPTAIAGKPPLRFAAAGRTWRISGSAIDVHMLTRAGQEIASIIDPPKFKPEHASALGSWLVRHHTTVEVAGSDGEFRPWDPRFP